MMLVPSRNQTESCKCREAGALREEADQKPPRRCGERVGGGGFSTVLTDAQGASVTVPASKVPSGRPGMGANIMSGANGIPIGRDVISSATDSGRSA